MILFTYESQKRILMKITVSSATLLITALLCVLKVTGILNISWLWCFCLVWLPFAILIGIMGLIALMIVLYAIVYVIFERIK